MSASEVRFAEQDGVAGGQLAEDLVQLAAADGFGTCGQDRAGVPLGRAGPGSDPLGDPAIELLDPEVLGLLRLDFGQLLSQGLRELGGEVVGLGPG